MKLKSLYLWSKLYSTWCVISITCAIISSICKRFGVDSNICSYLYYPLYGLISFTILYVLFHWIITSIIEIWKD